jgi:hypothetical protein
MNEQDEKVLRQMIQDSGEMWLAARPRTPFGADPIVICRNPECAYYLERAENYKASIEFEGGWIIEERPLRMSDADGFFAEFGSHWPYWLGAIVKGSPLRAFIKNGRKEGWSISLNMKTQAETDATKSLQRQRSASLITESRDNGPIRETIRNALSEE